MKTMVARILLVLLIAVLAVGPSLAQGDDPPLTQDQKKAAAARQKEADKQAAADKKAAEDKAKKDAKGKPKDSDIDNIGNRNINKGSINFTSIEKEIGMGKQAAAQVEQDVTLINDPVVTEYVNRVGQNLVRNSDATQYTFTIKVVDSDEINAFALPGGFLYVNSGLILAADDEAELAGVMAHEIGHVAARHATENMAKGTLAQVGMIPLIIFTGGIGGVAAQEVAQLGLPIGMFHFSKSAESEADKLGLEYMYKTGYDPAAAISFFEKLQAKESPRKVSGLFSTHPPTEERVKAEKKNIELILKDKDQYIVTTSEFDQVKARLASLENHKPAERQGPSLQRGRQGGGRQGGGRGPGSTPDDTNPSTRPDDRTPPPDDRPTLKRTDPANSN